MVRSGLLAQQQVIDVLNQYFIPVEFDATKFGGVPDDIPAFEFLRAAWNNNPWTRASFGTEWVLDPTGELALCMPPHKHLTIGIPVSNAERDFIVANAPNGKAALRNRNRLNAVLFQIALETGLKRFYRLQEHAPGTEGRRQAMEQMHAEVTNEIQTLRPCIYDVDLSTQHTLTALFSGDPDRFLHKLVGVLQYKQDSEVRRKAAAVLGRWAASLTEEQRGQEQVRFLGDQVARLLEDEDADVRESAATALFQFTGREAPDTDDAKELESKARAAWDDQAAGGAEER